VSKQHDIHAEKLAIRTRIRAAREALDLELCLEGAEKLADRLLALPEVAGAHMVLAYHSMPDEINPEPAVERLRALGATIAYPRIKAPGVLELRQLEAGAAMNPGPFGLAEPSVDAPHVDPSSVDLVLAPGVAFDSSGRRLGYGGGYFDRLIPQLREDCVLLGIAFDEQVIDLVPTESHDARMDAVITPTRTLWPDR